MVEDATGRTDHNLHPGGECAELPFVGLSAVDRHGVKSAGESGQTPDLLSDLHGEFARGAEHEHLHLFALHVDAGNRR